jgi:ElaB/YqjD/DUF883 family membrane-anchored ribosome-binding protein
MCAAVPTPAAAPDKLICSEVEQRGHPGGATSHTMENAMAHSSTAVIKKRLLADFNAVMSETDQLLKLVADEGGDKAGALRTKVERNLNSAKQQLRSLEDAVIETTRAGAHATDEYVHENPWQTMAVAAGLSAVVGAAIGLLLCRR